MRGMSYSWLPVCVWVLLTYGISVESKTIIKGDMEKNEEENESPLRNAYYSQGVDRSTSNMQAYQDPNLDITYNVDSENQFIEARDCSDFFKLGRTTSGVYVIHPKGFAQPFHVFCDMEKDGGGWTVIQRRGNYGTSDDYFLRTWDEYKRGFGDLTGEFWLGNDKISALTTQRKYRLKMDLLSTNWTSISLTYTSFKVGSEVEYYKLTVGELLAPETRDYMSIYNGKRFSTVDRDNTLHLTNCANISKGAGWYNDCYRVNLNGLKDSNDTRSYFKTHDGFRLLDSVLKIQADHL